MRKIKHLFEFIIVKTIFLIVSQLNIKLLYLFAEWLAVIMYYLIPVRKKMITANLKKAFPAVSKNELKKIIKKNYSTVAKAGLEYSIFHKINKKNKSEFASFEGLHIIDYEVKKERGIILLGAHFDNPELVTNLIRISTDYNMAALVKKQQNKYVHLLFEKIRKTNNIELIYKGASVKDIFRILKNKKILATVADTSISQKEGILLDFFNISTATPIGPAKFAVRTNSAVIPVFSYRLEDNTHKIIIHNPINWETLNCSESDKIKFIMQEYNNILEENIRKHPAQWFWMHNRWK